MKRVVGVGCGSMGAAMGESAARLFRTSWQVRFSALNAGGRSLRAALREPDLDSSNKGKPYAV